MSRGVGRHLCSFMIVKFTPSSQDPPRVYVGRPKDSTGFTLTVKTVESFSPTTSSLMRPTYKVLAQDSPRCFADLLVESTVCTVVVNAVASSKKPTKSLGQHTKVLYLQLIRYSTTCPPRQDNLGCFTLGFHDIRYRHESCSALRSAENFLTSKCERFTRTYSMPMLCVVLRQQSALLL